MTTICVGGYGRLLLLSDLPLTMALPLLPLPLFTPDAGEHDQQAPPHSGGDL